MGVDEVMSEYKVKPVLLAGLDIETTGTDLNKSHRLIQIGIVLPDGKRFSMDILPMGIMVVDPKALEVNGFTMERIQEGTPNDEADEILFHGLRSLGYQEGDLTPVGFNVGGFDLPFIKKELPKVSTFFSYRTLDLTGVAIMWELATGKSYRDLKDEFHKRVSETLGRDARHDALYDAEAALVCVGLFKELLNG